MQGNTAVTIQSLQCLFIQPFFESKPSPALHTEKNPGFCHKIPFVPFFHLSPFPFPLFLKLFLFCFVPFFFLTSFFPSPNSLFFPLLPLFVSSSASSPPQRHPPPVAPPSADSPLLGETQPEDARQRSRSTCSSFASFRFRSDTVSLRSFVLTRVSFLSLSFPFFFSAFHLLRTMFLGTNSNSKSHCSLSKPFSPSMLLDFLSCSFLLCLMKMQL